MKCHIAHTVTPLEGKSPESLIDIILRLRNIGDINAFLHPAPPESRTLLDFGFSEKGIQKAMRILETMYQKKEAIVVYTDYDADGITGGAILWETLHLMGFRVRPYVPHRSKEGYGFSKIGIDAVKKEFDPALIISVDHGISAVEQIRYADELGIAVIITDHHQKQAQIPKHAKSIFHIPELSGSAVSYYFAKEVFRRLDIPHGKKDRLEELFRTDYLALASIGTVADLVPLIAGSRALVKGGLRAFAQVNRAGIRALCEQAEIDQSHITPYEIGFMIAPRINAVGRLEHAIDALRLLCTTSKSRAEGLAQSIGDLNLFRQDLVKKSVAEAVAIVEHMNSLPPIIILYSETWHEGILGLIASKLVETYYRPAIVMSRNGEVYKASVRSIPALHVTHFLEQFKEYFIGYGGHAGAAGFTLIGDKRDAFIASATKQASETLKDEDLEKTAHADLAIPIDALSMELALRIEELAPFGIGNPKPVFVSDGEVIQARTMGKDQSHLKMKVADPKNKTARIEMVAFGEGARCDSLVPGTKVRVMYQLDINKWNGTTTIQGVIKHLL